MAQQEVHERSPRVRKDAKIALIVILALMVLVVVIWGRSPRPGDSLVAPPPTTDAVPPDTTAPAPDDVAAAPSDTAPADAETPEASPVTPAETAMMNHVEPDRGIIRNVAASPTQAPVEATPQPPAETPQPAPAQGTRPAATPAPATKPPAITHTVVKGDTYSKLALKYYKDANKWPLIQKANKGRKLLRIGDKLVIPPLPRTRATTDAAAPKPAPASAKPSKTKPSKPSAPPPRRRRGRTYVVKKGDTFIGIARTIYRDSAKWRDLYERNRSKLPNPAKPDSLRPGTVIEIPAVASTQ